MQQRAIERIEHCRRTKETTLDLAYSDLTDVSALADLTHLTHLSLIPILPLISPHPFGIRVCSNPFPPLLTEAIEQGNQAVIDYYEEINKKIG